MYVRIFPFERVKGMEMQMDKMQVFANIKILYYSTAMSPNSVSLEL